MLASALTLATLTAIVNFAETVITFPKGSETVSNDVLLPSDAALLLGLKSLETISEKNAVISPANLYTCLWLMYVGTKGDTKSELGHVLGSLGNESIANQLRNLSDVHVANAAFLDTSVTVKYDYATAGDRDVFSVDFTSAEITRQTINGWVSDQTKGAISTMFNSPLNPDTKAVIISALYFNASWLYPFDPQITRTSKFELTPEEYTEVALMSRYAPFLLYRASFYDAVGLPYAHNGFTLYIILPHSSGDRALKSVLRHLSPEEVNHIASSATETQLILSLPKFTVDHEMQLRPVLQSLGVNKLFDPQFADFGDLVYSNNGSNVFVSDIIQRVHLEVDEKGTRGGAATAAILTKSGKTTFIANRPFIYLLRHENGHVLFLGTYSQPPKLQ